MIDENVFREQLLTDLGYRTPDVVKRGFWFRLLGRTDFMYNLAVLGIVLRGGRLARSGAWSRASWLNLSLDMARTVEGCGGKFEITGAEHIAALKGPAIIVANHMSLLETFAIPSILLPFQDLTFVVKESLMRTPFIKDVMMGSRPISVGRENPREDFQLLIEKGSEVIAEGRSLVIFPQSTRSVTFIPSSFNSVGAKLAKRTGVPLLPLALKTDFQGLGKVFRDFGPIDRSKTVRFKFGPAVSATGTGREANEHCIRFIGETLRGWGGLVAE